MKNIFLILLALNTLLWLGSASASGMELGISYPVISTAEQMEFSAAAFRELGIRWFRTDIHWKLMEKRKGEVQWTFDKKVQWAQQNKFSMVATIKADGPDWACREKNKNSAIFKGPDDFERFVNELAKRYAGKIDIIQFGNEWQSSFWYMGTPQEFAAYNNIAYTAFKKHSPGTRFCLGGFSIGALRVLALNSGKLDSFLQDETGQIFTRESIKTLDAKNKKRLDEIVNRSDYVLKNALYDMADIHLYDDPENWLLYYNMINEMCSGKPVIVTEFGGPNLKIRPYNEDFHVQELGRYLQAIDAFNIQLALHFYMVEGDALHGKSALYRTTGKDNSSPPGYIIEKKKTWQVFREFITNQIQSEKK
ncbi:MAG: hypothetical protein A2096_05750 [Spirochaetes bacterium GWF1_41_5]|nr:MAG: hypothetical protein A2096_05750 [Spirochaetes bacterium GWF1_41_5]HBE03888.1 hypothetical protein [Spirochaetia bacterium]